MINSLTIENFKGFRSLHIDRMSRVNLITGVNGVGKTSVLEAIFLYLDRFNAESLVRQYKWRGIRSFDLTPASLFCPIFSDHDTGFDIRICPEIDGECHELRISAMETVSSEGVDQDELASSNSGSSSGNTSEIPLERTLRFTHTSNGATIDVVDFEITVAPNEKVGIQTRRPQVRGAAENEPVTGAFFGMSVERSSKHDAMRFDKLLRSGEDEFLLSVLREFDSRIKWLGVLVEGGEPIIGVDIGLQNKIPLPHLSEGINRVASLLLSTGYAKGGVLFADDIAAGVHYKFHDSLWRAVERASAINDCQVIATTHSYDVIKAAAQVFSGSLHPEFEYLRLDRVGANVECVCYSAGELFDALDSGWEVRG